MRELSGAEWHVLESLWADSPKVGSQIVGDMETRKGWSRSTTLTMLRRMTEKGLVSCDNSGKVKSYAALIHREDAVKKGDGKLFGQGLSGQRQYDAKQFCGEEKAFPGGNQGTEENFGSGGGRK